MTSDPTVSVIIPVYNVEKQLDRCIGSIINQTYKSLDIVLVDDGSSDSSGLICDKYAKSDSRIRVIHKKNGGVSSARNAALKIIYGDYVIFLDGDDSLDLETIEYCVKSTENCRYDIVVFGYHLFLEDDKNCNWIRDDNRVPYNCDSKDSILYSFVKLEKAGYFGFVTDKLIRTSLIRNNRLSFNSYFDMGGEDGVFIIELLPFVSNIKVVDKCFYNYYRRNNISMTVSFNPGRFERYYKRLEITYAFMKQYADSIDERFLIENYCKYILWSYESMLSSTCRLTNKQRYKYISNAFLPRNLYDGFYSKVKQYIHKKNAFLDYSRSSRLALKWIIMRRYKLAYLLHKCTLKHLEW